MKKTIMCLGTMTMMLAATMMTSSCKNTSEGQTEEEAALEEVLGLFDELDGALKGAQKACGEDCEDDELEFITLDVVTDDDGEEIPVAYFKSGEDIFQLMDIDGDGTFDVAVFDSNDDGEIDDDEIVDVSEENITIDDLEEYEGGADYEDEEYVTDEPESIVERTSRDAGPATQRREDALEADLPDYVNNARVKAMRHK